MMSHQFFWSATALIASALAVAACGEDAANNGANPDDLPDGGFVNNDPDPVDTGTPDAEEQEHLCPDFEGERPASRSEMMGIFDTARQRMVFFGGDDGEPVQCSASPHPIGELWVYDNRCAVFEREAIQDGPGGRARGVAVHDTTEDRMLVFGGRFREARSGPYTLYNEVWALDLSTFAWELLQTTGGGPSPRVNTAAVYNPDKHEMVVFGGNSSNNGAAFIPQNDVWILDLETRAWRELGTSADKPVARLFHAAALDIENNLLYVHGGGDERAFFGPFFADLWQLNVTSGVWTQLHDGNGVGVPDDRIFSTMVFDKASGQLVLFGGHDGGQVGNNNDTWRFEVEDRQWIEIIPPEVVNTPANGFCDFPPDFTIPNLDAPDRRSAHLAVLDDIRGELIIFGGKTDCGIIDDVWSFDLARDSWINLKPATKGEACVRGDNPDLCVGMCGAQ